MNIISKRDYRMVVLSDEHCGHLSGLTHPEYQGKFISDNTSKHNKLTRVQKDLWSFFEKEIVTLQKEKPIDILVNNGDFLDGRGEKSGSTELLTADRNFQIHMCKKIVETVDASHNLIIQGTDYHCSSDGEDWEQVLASELKCKYATHDWLDINKVVFDFKHHCVSSAIPHGRFNGVAKDALWAKLWSEAKLIPNKINYLIRSHVHYFSLIDDGSMIALTTPALQAYGSKYGARRCSGIPTIGFVSYDIKANGSVSMQKHLAYIVAQTSKATVFK